MHNSLCVLKIRNSTIGLKKSIYEIFASQKYLKNGPPSQNIFACSQNILCADCADCADCGDVRIVGMCGPVHLFSRDVSIGEWIRSLDVASQERQPLHL